MLERVGERERVVRFAVVGDILANAIDEVTAILTILMPSNVLLLTFLVGVD